MPGGEGVMGQGSSLSKAPEMEKTCACWGCPGSGHVLGVGLESPEVGISERGGGRTQQEEAVTALNALTWRLAFIL